MSLKLFLEESEAEDIDSDDDSDDDVNIMIGDIDGEAVININPVRTLP